MRTIYSMGFSLIELMIVISIIGILTVIALPSYRRYIERARFAEVMMAANSYKTAVSIALAEGLPLKEISNGTNGIPTEASPTKNLASIRVVEGIITATATDLALNATYILKPTQDGSVWSLSGTCLKLGLCHA